MTWHGSKAYRSNIRSSLFTYESNWLKSIFTVKLNSQCAQFGMWCMYVFVCVVFSYCFIFYPRTLTDTAK